MTDCLLGRFALYSSLGIGDIHFEISRRFDMEAVSALLSDARGSLRRIDRVWAFVLVFVVALSITLPDQARESVLFALRSLAETAPFLILAVALAAYAKATGADGLIARAFDRRGVIGGVIVASLAGALSPFCSCGVIPLIAALLSMGVPLPAVMAFWLSSPLMDPSMFALTAGVIAPEFAVAKTVAAIGVGVGGGVVTAAILARGGLSDPLRPGIGNGGCGGGKVRSTKPVVWSFWEESERWTKFRVEALSAGLFLVKWLTLAYLIESVMLAWIPAEAFVEVLGGDGWFAVPLAAAVGVPAYLNGYAAAALVGGLIDAGMAPGAGMAFLIAGGVTSIPAAIAVWALARPPVFGLYLGLSAAGAVVSGFAYGAWAVL